MVLENRDFGLVKEYLLEGKERRKTRLDHSGRKATEELVRCGLPALLVGRKAIYPPGSHSSFPGKIKV